MGIAGVVNMTMLLVAAALFHKQRALERGHCRRAPTTASKRSWAAARRRPSALALLASGFASSSVGTYAGQIVMQGFIARRIPLMLRRLVTMAPALIVLAVGADPTHSLVISQVVLSFGIPFALVPLVMFTSRRDLMGSLVNRRATTIAACLLASLIIGLNLFLLARTFGL